MRPIHIFFTASAILSSSIFATQASAISDFGSKLNSAYPGKILYTSPNCTVCHANTSGENIAWFSQYGNILRANGANYESLGTFPNVIVSAGTKDYDNDGFTVNQEIAGDSFSNGGLAGNPALILKTNIASVTDLYSKVVGLATTPLTAPTPVTLSDIYSALDNSAYITIPAGHKNITSGFVEYTLSGVTDPYGTVKLLFSTGGIQTTPSLPTVKFIDTYSGTATQITASSVAGDGGSWTVGTDGSITVSISDDGAFDLYSSAPGSVFYDPYASAGIIKTRLAITTTVPTVGSVSGFGGGGDDEGGLHCMTSGLSTYGFMLLGLLTTGLLVRRKRS